MINEDFVRNYWLPALRSGEYQQAVGWLNVVEGCEEEPAGYCCLGVACDLIAKHELVEGAHWEDDVKGRRDFVVGERRRGDVLPRGASDFIGIRPGGTLRVGVKMKGDGGEEQIVESLVDLNDDLGFSFAEIADFIESVVDGKADTSFALPRKG